MFDLSREKVDVKCSCGKKHIAMLQDAINKRVIRCSCGTNIQLNDSGGSVKKGVSEMNKAFQDLENAFKGLGR